jgi:hypothetical protein
MLAVVVAEQEGEAGQIGAELGEVVAVGADAGDAAERGDWLRKVSVSARSAASRCTCAVGIACSS